MNYDGEIQDSQELTITFGEMVEYLHETKCFDQYRGTYSHDNDENVVKNCKDTARQMFINLGQKMEK